MTGLWHKIDGDIWVSVRPMPLDERFEDVVGPIEPPAVLLAIPPSKVSPLWVDLQATAARWGYRIVRTVEHYNSLVSKA